ncbi:hypothetical protein [Owenweeksia hongkongensis]|uniref:hypothetical protein n=1 Tax=Owenweeksia hongkongensis TaxID=253245 RepID=UPI003A8D57AA
MEKIRYYNKNTGPSEENEKKAFQKALSLSKEIESIDQIVLLIHTKNNTGYIERIFGTRNVGKFFTGKVFDHYPSIKIETIKTFTNDYDGKKIVVALGLDSKELFKYDDYPNVIAIIAHQWRTDGVTDWANSWQALEVTTGNKADAVKLPHPVVQEAFKNLTRTINLSTGINHGSDEHQCKTYLRALNKYNFPLNSSEVQAYLTTQLNWSFENTKDVIILIDKLSNGGYFKGGEKTGLKAYIKGWEAQI